MQNTFEILEFHDSDLPRAAELAADAWPTVANIVGSENLHKLMHVYVELALLGTTWKKKIINHEGYLMGFLFGGVHKEIGWKMKWKGLKYLIGLNRRIANGEAGMIENPKEFLNQFGATERVIQSKSPKAEAEIQLFVMDKNCRGKGLGRQLMDEFKSYLLQKNIHSMKLYTDPLSTWQFYERYGFSRYAEFQDPLNSYITKQPTAGYIYYLKF